MLALSAKSSEPEHPLLFQGDMWTCMRDKCPRRCKRRSFKAAVVTSKLAQSAYRDGDVHLDIFYTKFQQRKYTEKVAMDLANFVGTIGGIIGAWTGMSFIAFTRLVILAISKLCQLLHKGLLAITLR
jgi:Amiloride-sensitive sodium channel